MSASPFFGDQSPFQVIVAVVAFATAIYTFYKSFLEKAKISAFPGDRLSFVISAGGSVRKFHLRTNLVNKSIKTGTLHRLEAMVQNPSGESHRFEWKLFFEYLPGGQAVQPSTDPYPVSVAGKSSSPLFAEFEVAPNQELPQWRSGRYQVKLIGWVNKKNRGQKPNLETVFHLDLTDAVSQQLTDERPPAATLVTVPIVEWSIDCETGM